ncbi:MAG: LptA/OstA family protein [Bradyrhizobiaceae bacterium]|nr:LptA/OstA family protein [Bradyrhizobiaceae bacterium]
MIKFGNIASSRRRAVAVLAAALAAAGVAAAAAQPGQHKPPSGPPNALQGFSQNRDKPVKINADELEVHDKDKLAVFSGNVHLIQGDTDLRTSKLVVYYDDQPPRPANSAKTGAASAEMTPQQNQQIKRVEAKGGVMVVQKQKDQKDQRATGDEGIFDMRANTVTMVGNVVISQGESVLKGENLTVNMTTGDALLTANPNGATCKDPKDPTRCRVSGVFNPSAMKQDGVSLPGHKP